MMRNLKFQFGLVALLLLTLGSFSCAREDEVIVLEESTKLEVTKDSGYDKGLPPNESAILKHIADHKKERTRSYELTILEPVVYGGDTVMYVANYDEGWEVFSNSTTMPMVLMRSETGRFDASVLAGNPAFAAFFDMSKANLAIEMHDADAEAQPGSEEWEFYALESRNGGPMRKPAPEPLVLVGTGFSELERDITGHLLHTKWHQQFPYNEYIPLMLNGNHAPAGCSPVAIAQYLYYWHDRYGLPAYCVTSATYNSLENTYNFFGSSVTIWNNMPWGDSGDPTQAAADPAALLIGNMAKILNTEFAQVPSEGSGTQRDEFAPCVNAQTNQNLSLKEFISESIYNLIKNNKPVITSLRNDVYGTGHTVVTDYTKRELGYKDYYYVPKSIAGDIQPGDVLESVGLNVITEKYGSPNVTVDRQTISLSYYFKVNWGWGPNASDPEINGALMQVNYPDRTYSVIYAVY